MAALLQLRKLCSRKQDSGGVLLFYRDRKIRYSFSMPRTNEETASKMLQTYSQIQLLAENIEMANSREIKYTVGHWTTVL
jgi:hypothetical protein